MAWWYWKKKDDEGLLLHPAPPYELSLALDCIKFHALPKPGGVLDQPIFVFRKMKTLLNVYYMLENYASASENLTGESYAKWYSKNRDIVKFVKDLRSNEDASSK